MKKWRVTETERAEQNTVSEEGIKTSIIFSWFPNPSTFSSLLFILLPLTHTRHSHSIPRAFFLSFLGFLSSLHRNVQPHRSFRSSMSVPSLIHTFYSFFLFIYLFNVLFCFVRFWRFFWQWWKKNWKKIWF